MLWAGYLPAYYREGLAVYSNFYPLTLSHSWHSWYIQLQQGILSRVQVHQKQTDLTPPPPALSVLAIYNEVYWYSSHSELLRKSFQASVVSYPVSMLLCCEIEISLSRPTGTVLRSVVQCCTIYWIVVLSKVKVIWGVPMLFLNRSHLFPFHWIRAIFAFNSRTFKKKKQINWGYELVSNGGFSFLVSTLCFLCSWKLETDRVLRLEALLLLK